MLERDKSKNLYELRRVIESGSIVLASENCQPEEIELLKDAVNKLIEELRKEPPSVKDVLAADIHFHDVIMQMTHNQLLQRINTSITTVTYPARVETLERNFRNGEIDFLVETHVRMAEKIISGTSDEISDLIGYSLSNWKETLKQH